MRARHILSLRLQDGRRIDEAHLSALREAARLWNEPDFWQHAELDAGMIRFDEEKIGISALSSMILHDAIREKIEASAMRLDQLPALLPHLRKFGWPGDSVSTMPVRVAFRLTEPDADSDTEWLLETVVVSERGTHWTPAVRKANADIGDALPAKWKEYADEIREKQSEMVSFLRSVEADPENRFLSIVMTDPEVRMFIQEDLPVFQSFGYPVILPAWLKSVTESRMRVRTSASVQSYRSAAGLDEVLSFDWNFSLAGKEIDQDYVPKAGG